VLFLEFVVWRFWIRVAPLPELLDELVPLLVGGEFLKDALLFLRNDVIDVLGQPFSVVLLQLLLLILLFRFLLLAEHRTTGKNRQSGGHKRQG